MTDPTELTPPTPDPSGPIAFTGGSVSSPSWWSRWHRHVIGGVGAAVVLAAAGTGLFLVLTPTTTVDKMVPASADVYGLVNIDPSATQKLNLLQAVHRFPDTSTDQKITDQLDKAFKDSGLTFSGDVKPWLGAQLAFALQLPKDSSSDPPTALLVASRDDAKAAAALTKLQTGTYGKNYRWQTKTYDGVTIMVGTPNAQSAKPGAYALVDHVVVIATSEDFIHQIIDTDRGRAARLIDSSDYKATFAKLPSDRLALVYVNGKSLVTKLKSEMSNLASPTMQSILPLNSQGIGDANALQGVGLVLSARSDGVVLDLAAKLDASKLSAATKAALAQSSDASGVVAWIPTTAEGFWSATGIRQGIQAALDQMGSDPSVQSSTDAIGLTGPGGVLQHLTGDAGLEATVDASLTPAGAMVLGTDNAAAMQKFFGGLLTLAAAEESGSKVVTSTYRGVKITTLDLHQPALAGTLAPSYAVLDGMGIVASRRAELVAVIDAHKDHHSIAGDAAYAAASRASISHPTGILYFNLARLVTTIERVAPQLGASTLDSNTRADLRPLKAFILTANSSQDGILERLIVFLQ
ncbi:MAG TPA: DUF3352 domain-containing protein [Candidatus Dormibacteraeota bacterium]|nr:DUF3352 domain-containing protein [Candidatus Dormibacteraeota bacterium]